MARASAAERRICSRPTKSTAVPRYFFNVHDSKDIKDIDGTVLSDEGHARTQAITTAAEILRSEATGLG